MYYISQYIQLQAGTVLFNGNPFFHSEHSEFKGFAKELYQKLELQYPKFYKMDNLCKLAFLASEIILQGNQESDIALLFSNQEASLGSDLQHQAHIQDPEQYYPSPAVFVYTLPNISIGEVSIRHQFKSESMFLLADAYPSTYLLPYTQYLLASGKAKKVLCGWFRMQDDNYEACCYLVEKEGPIAHETQTIEQIINRR